MCVDDPVLINSHSGNDYFTGPMVDEFFQAAVEIQERTRMHGTLPCVAPPHTAPAVPIAHETHRARILYSPWTTRDILARHPKLRYVADIRFARAVLPTSADVTRLQPLDQCG